VDLDKKQNNRDKDFVRCKDDKAKEFLLKLLAPNPEDRLSAEAAASYQW